MSRAEVQFSVEIPNSELNQQRYIGQKWFFYAALAKTNCGMTLISAPADCVG